MTPEQIREVVKITLDELKQRELIKDEYNYTLKDTERKLKSFFNNRDKGTNIGYALRQLSDDPYIDVILCQYRDGMTLERIAEALDKDVSTIKRNKKRLILAINNIMEEL